MIRILLTFSAVLFCGSIGAFFLFVPPLLIATVSIALVALPLAILVLLDCYDIHVELRQSPPSDDIDRTHRRRGPSCPELSDTGIPLTSILRRSLRLPGTAPFPPQRHPAAGHPAIRETNPPHRRKTARTAGAAG